MDPKALAIAKSRLRVAARAIEDLRQTITDPDAFGDHWFVFLTAWKGVYTVLEQGAKASPQSRQWFGGKATERRGDPMLQYLFEARNDEEHGLASTVRHTQGGTRLRFTGDVSSSFRLGFDQTGHTVGGFDDNGNLVAEVAQHVAAGPELSVVTARDKRKLEPPSEHMGDRIDIRPVPIAEIALAYAEEMVRKAEHL